MSSEFLHTPYEPSRDSGTRIITSVVATVLFLGVMAALGAATVEAMPNAGKKILTGGIFSFMALVGALGISGSLYHSRT